MREYETASKTKSAMVKMTQFLNTGDRCSAILQSGIFNSIEIQSSSRVGESLFEWLKEASYSEVKSKMDSGLNIAFPVEGVPISLGANHTEDEFNAWKRDVQSGKGRTFTNEEAYQIIQKSVDPNIVAAWVQCIKETSRDSGLAVGLSGDLKDTDNPDHFIFQARYIPDSVDSAQVPKILNSGFQVAGASPQAQNFVEGAEIPFAGISVILVRNGDSAITVVLNTTRGTLTDSRPARHHLLPSEVTLRAQPIQSDQANSLTFKLWLDCPSDSYVAIDSVFYTFSNIGGSASDPQTRTTTASSANPSSRFEVTTVCPLAAFPLAVQVKIDAEVHLKSGETWKYNITKPLMDFFN